MEGSLVVLYVLVFCHQEEVNPYAKQVRIPLRKRPPVQDRAVETYKAICVVNVEHDDFFAAKLARKPQICNRRERWGNFGGMLREVLGGIRGTFWEIRGSFWEIRGSCENFRGSFWGIRGTFWKKRHGK